LDKQTRTKVAAKYLKEKLNKKAKILADQ
jgi:hypothetical protein